MKMVAIAFVVLSACGKSKCQGYAQAFCAKAEVCLSLNFEQCEKDTLRAVEKSGYDEDTCEKAEHGILAMTCAEFREFYNN